MEQNHYIPTLSKADDDDNEPEAKPSYTSFVEKKTDSVLHVYFSNLVESDRTRYHKLLHDLRTAGGHDYVILYLACYGGDVYSGTQIINAIRDCPVPVHIVVDAPCFSMASIIALQGASLTMKSETYLMFHNYSGGQYGKGFELITAAAHYEEFSRKGNQRQLYPFLSKAEIAKLPKDHDIYVNFDDPDLKKRIKRHFKGRK